MRFFTILGALALVSSAIAQNVTECVSGDVCYAVNVPEATASNGSGEIYIQISGPSTLSWIGIGQGSGMTGANIFMVYANAAGNNVTLSPRRGVGNRQPNLGSTADVTLLEGSGISNGIMTANFRCSNCNSWQGGSMNLADSGSSWIWAYLSGQQISSDSVDARVSQHSDMGEMTLNLQNAVGGSSSNPFVATVAAANPSSQGSESSSGEADGEDGEPSSYSTVLMVHAILSPLAFVVFFPLGAITMRLISFKGLIWMHAGWMLFTYLIVLTSMGLAVWMAVQSSQLNTYHSIIGLVVVGCLILQPVTGLVHHLLYKKRGRPNMATYPHIWWGRAIITLGIINGGLGLMLSGNTRKGEIAYGVVAGFMWLLWMAVILIAFIRSRNAVEGETKKFVLGRHDSTEKMRHSSSLQQDSHGRNSITA